MYVYTYIYKSDLYVKKTEHILGSHMHVMNISITSIASICIYIYLYLHPSKYCHQFMQRNLRYATSILRSNVEDQHFDLS